MRVAAGRSAPSQQYPALSVPRELSGRHGQDWARGDPDESDDVERSRASPALSVASGRFSLGHLLSGVLRPGIGDGNVRARDSSNASPPESYAGGEVEVEAAALQDSESNGGGRHDEFMPLEGMGPRAGAEGRSGALEGSTSWDAERQIAKSPQGTEWGVAMHRDEVGRSGSLTPREVAARRGAARRGREDQHGQGVAIDAALGTRPKVEQPGGRAAALRHDLAGRSAQGEWRGERLPTRAEGDDDDDEEEEEEEEEGLFKADAVNEEDPEPPTQV